MPTPSHTSRESPARRQRRRRTHHRVDSNGDLAPSRRRGHHHEDSASPSPTKTRSHRHQDTERRSSRPAESVRTRTTTSTPLSAGQLAQLDNLNRKLGWDEYERPRRQRVREVDEDTRAGYDVDREREREERERERERRRQEYRERKRRQREAERLAALEAEDARTDDFVYEQKRPPRRDRERVVSGQRLERGSDAYYSENEKWRDDVRRRDETSSDLEYEDAERRKKRWRNIFIAAGVLVLILAIAIPVGIVVSRKSDPNSGNSSGSNSTQPSNGNLNGMSESDIPKQWQGTYLDPFTWYDTTDFNVTFTSEMVGGLPLMGLNSTWDDSTRANDQTPPLNQAWQYGTVPVRGVNLGGWLSIEPVLTPSMFSGYTTHDNVIDEWTLTSTLGASKAKSMLEKHYSSWVSEQTFADIQAAGFDHVRIPFSYWAVVTYDGDPYVANVSFRYLLRGIEWARKHGLRVNLDLHGAPGSQNGWNHSGRQGVIGWLNGTDGQLNADRTLSIHDQLSTFFTQPRYQNIITMYGLVNEPRMVELDTEAVLNWTTNAAAVVRKNGYNGTINFGDGFMGLQNWQGKLQNIPNLLLDVHQYVIFNVQQIVLNHHDKIQFACAGWTQQSQQSMNKATGFGPTLCGEWSQADTDCAQYLNNVGVGSRWEGTLNMADTPGGSLNGSVLSPTCPTHNNPQCSCDNANAAPSAWSAEYKQWLLMFAEAQMYSFEQSWGWFYWTWKTESAAQWSYQAGMAAGVLPQKAYQRDFYCNGTIPDFASLGLPEYY